MAKDFDFSRVPRQPDKVASAPLNSPHKSKKTHPLMIVVVIVVILGSIAVIYGLFMVGKDMANAPSILGTSTPDLTPHVATKTPTAIPTVTITPTITATTTATAIPVGTTSGITIKIYDAGAGDSAVATTIAALTAKGYKTENLGKSQLEMADTTISYRNGLATQANDVALILKDKNPVVNQSNLTSVFDIIIWLGTI